MIKLALAEDVDLLREDLIESIEEYEDIEVIGDFDNGHSIVDFIKNGGKPDVILMDISMETKEAGVWATGEIKKLDPDIEIIYLTAYENDELILKSMEKGAIDYVVKDIDIGKLIDKVRKAYKKEAIINPSINNRIMNEYTRLRMSERSLLFFIQNVGNLTKTENVLIKYLIQGMTNKQIAELRHVEMNTIKTQIKNLLRKFGCTRKKEMIEMIYELGLEKLFCQDNLEE